jgi:hypothetical protein
MHLQRLSKTAPASAGRNGFRAAAVRMSIVFAGLTASLLSLRADAGDVQYRRDIRPLLSDRCFLCHGPDKGTREADLRLDTKQGAFAPLASDAKAVAIKPGAPDESEVFKRIASADPDERMPPPESKLSLKPAEIELIRQWIAQGARYEDHWAFVPPQKAPLPASQSDPWVKNEVDAFVLDRMREQRLTPSPPAAKETLLRRATFDLTGLPPTLTELDAFLADNSPAALERAVDRLLASPRFGERMAADWLDVARYSDTYGLQVDRDRFVWPWRDWVIRAFNRNLPYDQFIVQQLAGDLLPNADDEAVLATTFSRLHPQEAEGGSIPEEFRVSYVADRVQTFGTAFLGLTLECARCHDHKFDPITQKEYYQLFAYFDDIDEAGLYSYFTPAIPTPTLLLADDAAKQKLAELSGNIHQAENRLKELQATRQESFRAWLETHPVAPAPLVGESAALDFENVSPPNQAVPGVAGSAIQLTGDDGVEVKAGNFHRYEPFSVSLWMQTPDEKHRAVVFHRSRAWTDSGSRGYELLLDDGRLSAAVIHFDPGNSLRIVTKDKLPLKNWRHVAVTYDGSSRAAGLRLFVDGQPAAVEVVRDCLTKDITGGGGDNIVIGERFRDHGFTNGLVDEFRVFARELSPLEVRQLHDGQAFTNALAAHMSSPGDEALRAYYQLALDADYQAQLAALRQARQAQSEFIETIPEIMVMRDLAVPKHAFRLERGAYDARAEEVSPGTPAAFSPPPAGAPGNRLGLAQWLTDSQHPLTARVIVNRYWQMLFGAGLTRTTEDMGNQGEQPSHPQLLDWLARDFIDHGWDLKRLLKQMVLSATYQQSSTVTPDREALDPANRWLSRAPSYRLSAEMLRDNALAVSGLLVDRIGGPPARPYEVEAAFKPQPRDQGDGLYRRSLYTYWSRTGPAPAMMALDAAKRDVCQMRRERTLSPLQPLVLLNGPQFVEAARMLAQQVLERHKENTDAALIDMFRWTTSRRPNQQELAILQKLYQQQLKDFAGQRDEAVSFLSVGDHPRNAQLDVTQLAALTGVANLLLNYDECVFRR